AKSVVFLHWKINQTEIIQNYCENKDKPEMACNGKCHLSKEILKLDPPKSEDQSNALHLSCFNFQFSPFILSDKPNVFKNFGPISFHYYSLYSLSYETNYLSSIFHPPAQLFV
ncbi:MAG: hypothetical protein KA797_05965, partial [Chitinophagales bacterium]|nr:hypothetical protein [Chitinophagales bacterium]